MISICFHKSKSNLLNLPIQYVQVFLFSYFCTIFAVSWWAAETQLWTAAHIFPILFFLCLSSSRISDQRLVLWSFSVCFWSKTQSLCIFSFTYAYNRKTSSFILWIYVFCKSLSAFWVFPTTLSYFALFGIVENKRSWSAADVSYLGRIHSVNSDRRSDS